MKIFKLTCLIISLSPLSAFAEDAAPESDAFTQAVSAEAVKLRDTMEEERKALGSSGNRRKEARINGSHRPDTDPAIPTETSINGVIRSTVRNIHDGGPGPQRVTQSTAESSQPTQSNPSDKTKKSNNGVSVTRKNPEK